MKYSCFLKVSLCKNFSKSSKWDIKMSWIENSSNSSRIVIALWTYCSMFGNVWRNLTYSRSKMHLSLNYVLKKILFKKKTIRRESWRTLTHWLVLPVWEITTRHWRLDTDILLPHILDEQDCNFWISLGKIMF